MQKIPSLFLRNYNGDGLAINQVNPLAQWVVDGEAQRSHVLWDGVACLVKGGRLYKRVDRYPDRIANLHAANSLGRPIYLSPYGCEDAQEYPDPITGHWPGWAPVDMEGITAKDEPYREAWAAEQKDRQISGMYKDSLIPEDGTLELVGPAIRGNPYGLGRHYLERHGLHIVCNVPTDYDALRQFFVDNPHLEGVVWEHRTDRRQRLVKEKRVHFGLPWPTPEAKGQLDRPGFFA